MGIYVVPDPNETKLEYLKRRASAKFQDCKDWVCRNKEAVIVLTPILLGGVTTIAKVVGKRVNLNKEKAVKNLYCYDFLYMLRRKM